MTIPFNLREEYIEQLVQEGGSLSTGYRFTTFLIDVRDKILSFSKYERIKNFLLLNKSSYP